MSAQSNKETYMYELINSYYKRHRQWHSNAHLCNAAGLAIKTVTGTLRALQSDGHTETDCSLNITGYAFVRANWLAK